MKKNLEKLSVVIPYRNREKHLNSFLNTFPLLCNWDNFHIFVIEQYDDKPFIRGAMFNIGFLESKDYDFHCFHDVDMLPINADYSIPDTPAHLAMHATQFTNYYPGNLYYGGVNLFKKNHFETINGFSNSYPVWGSEDDDLRRRVLESGFPLVKRKGFFLSLPHQHIGPTHEYHNSNLEKLNSNYNFKLEGLNSIKYNLVSKELLTDFCTKIKVTL
jgi:hypothetical protein